VRTNIATHRGSNIDRRTTRHESRAVFREPLAENRGEIGRVSVNDVRTRMAFIDWLGNLGDGVNPGRDLEILSDRRFRMTIDTVPANFPPYVLEIGVRPGEGAYLGWPTFIGTVEFGAE
jgi:hypothetical protein